MNSQSSWGSRRNDFFGWWAVSERIHPWQWIFFTLTGINNYPSCRKARGSSGPMSLSVAAHPHGTGTPGSRHWLVEGQGPHPGLSRCALEGGGSSTAPPHCLLRFLLVIGVTLFSWSLVRGRFLRARGVSGVVGCFAFPILFVWGACKTNVDVIAG